MSPELSRISFGGGYGEREGLLKGFLRVAHGLANCRFTCWATTKGTQRIVEHLGAYVYFYVDLFVCIPLYANNVKLRNDGYYIRMHVYTIALCIYMCDEPRSRLKIK